MKIKVIGVINATPDSFYSPSRVSNKIEALALAETMLEDGADIIEIGGEATNPNLNIDDYPVSENEELDRVLDILVAIQQLNCATCIDTSKPLVMEHALKHGINMINDQRALQAPGSIDLLAKYQVPVCIMHMFGKQRIPESCPLDVMFQQVQQFLIERAKLCIESGILPENIIIDPGFGGGIYGKSTKENLYMLKHLSELQALNYKIFVGFSRKSFIGEILNVPAEDRLHGSTALNVIATIKGANYIRTHDVKPTVHALKILNETLMV